MDLSKKIIFLVILSLFASLVSGCENNTENSLEKPDMDYIQEDTTGDEIPPELIGTWEASEGLPQGLITYSLTFGEDGQVTQVSQIEDGDETTENSRFILDGNTVKILDPNNTVLMALDYSDGNLSTEDLGNQKTLFSKKN